MSTLSLIFIAGVALYVGLAAVIDFRQHRVPNYLTVPAALAGFAVGFGLLLLPWLFGGGGMGDVKLLAALGAWLGPVLMLVAFALSILTAAVLALGVLMWVIVTGGIQRAQRNYLGGRIGVADRQATVADRKTTNEGQTPGPRRQRLLPFAVPVALSVWCMLAWMVVQGKL